MMRRDRLVGAAMAAVVEQDRAAELREAGRFRFLADDDDCPDVLRLAALAEELGEVARCMHDGDDGDGIHRELLQLAGIAIAWASVT